MGLRWAVIGILLVACGHEERPRAIRKAAPAVELRTVVGEPQAISPTEDVRIVRVPSPEAPDERSLDNICVIYRNRELMTAQFVCPAGIAAVENFAGSGS